MGIQPAIATFTCEAYRHAFKVTLYGRITG